MISRIDKIKLLVMALVVGTAVFLQLYGTTPLHTANDNWIMAAIDEDDIIQHYAGWTMFRSGEWTFPIGMISGMARGTGTTLTYTDSIPWVAVFFKILFGITGYTGDFQYFGLFTLACFILQAYAAGLLIRRRSDSLLYAMFGMVLFCFAPPLLDRSLRHTALGAQFLILFAMLAYFRCRDEGYKKIPSDYVLLAVVSVGIHPYFLPMVMIFSLLTAIEGIKKTKNVLPWLGQFVLSCGAAAGAGYLLGAFSGSGDVERGGFGHYSMNLLAPVNPEGGTGYVWSKSLPALGLANGNYEGFNFLGFGIILLGITLVVLALIDRAGKHGWFLENGIKEHKGYFLVMLFMTLFAVSNVVTFGDRELVTLFLPEAVKNLCGIFRSSGRMFYPVFYSIYLFVIYRLWDFASKNGLRTKKGKPCPFVLPVLALAVTAALQVADLSAVIKEKHSRMAEAAFYMNLLDDPTLLKMAEGCDYIVGTDKFRDVCVFAGLCGMDTSFSASTGGTWDEAYAMRDSYIEDLENGVHDNRTMFVTKSWTYATDWIKVNPDMEMYQYGDRYFVAPKRGDL